MQKINQRRTLRVEICFPSRQWLSLCLITLGLLLAFPRQAQGQGYLPKLGGTGGGSFDEPCPAGQNLTGFEVRTGDDVDAIRPLCVISSGPSESSSPNSDSTASGWHGGSGGHIERVLCPPRTPIVLGIDVMSEGEKTRIVNSIMLFCGKAVSSPQPLSKNPSAVFEAPYYAPSGGLFTGADPANRFYESERCDSGQVAVGMHGRSGIWLDAMGLICDTPRVASGPPQAGIVVKSLGRTGAQPLSTSAGSVCDAARDARARHSPAAANLEAQCRANAVKSIGRTQSSSPSIPICDSARAARARQSPAAPNLEAQCRAQGGDPAPVSVGYGPVPTFDLDRLAAKGAIIANSDPLSNELRNLYAEGPGRRGFDIGMAASEGQTEWGPGKQRIVDSLDRNEQVGFNAAVSFSLDRNRNAQHAAIGAAIAQADPMLAQARSKEPDIRYWLGFDIATGIFGDPSLGADGNTTMGPGARRIRDGLSEPAQRGFNASVEFNLSRLR